MPRFHIHVHNHIGRTQDEEGAEYPSLDHAARKAIEGVRGILSEEVCRGLLDLRGRIEIADPGGQVLRTISFKEVVHLRQNGDSG